MSYSAALQSAAPSEIILVNADDDPVALQYGKIYECNNDGASPATDYDLDLPVITMATKGLLIHIRTRYDNEPRTTGTLAAFGAANLKRSGSDDITFEGAANTELSLEANDDDIVLSHDGIGNWNFR